MEYPSRPSALNNSGVIFVEPLGGTPVSQPVLKSARTSEATNMEEDGRTNGEAVGVSGVEGGVGVVSATGSGGNASLQVPSLPGGGLVGVEFGPAANRKGQGHSASKGQGYVAPGGTSTPYSVPPTPIPATQVDASFEFAATQEGSLPGFLPSQDGNLQGNSSGAFDMNKIMSGIAE